MTDDWVVCCQEYNTVTKKFEPFKSARLSGEPVDLSEYEAKLSEGGNPFRPMAFLSSCSVIVPSRGREVPLPFDPPRHPERLSISHLHELSTCLLYQDIYEDWKRCFFWMLDLATETWSKLPEAPFNTVLRKHIAEWPGVGLVFLVKQGLVAFDRRTQSWSAPVTSAGLSGVRAIEAHGQDLVVLKSRDQDQDRAHLQTWRLSKDEVLEVVDYPGLPSHGPLIQEAGYPDLQFATRALFGSLGRLVQAPDVRQRNDLEFTPVCEFEIKLDCPDLVFSLECGHLPAVGMAPLSFDQPCGVETSTMYFSVGGVTARFPDPIIAYHYSPNYVQATPWSLIFMVERRRLHRYDFRTRTWQALPSGVSRYATCDFTAVLDTAQGELFVGHLDHISWLAGKGLWTHLPEIDGHVVSMFVTSARLFVIQTVAKKVILASLPLGGQARQAVWTRHCQLEGVPLAKNNPLVCRVTSQE
jgi:hypothetical protein